MERIAVILALFVLLMNGRHFDRRPPPVARDIVITATPVTLAPHDPGRRTVGALRYLGGWQLTSPLSAFGGISAMRVADDGRFVMLNDSGDSFTFRLKEGAFAARYRPLPPRPGEEGLAKWHWDTESLAFDPATKREWAGFELSGRICRYAPGFARVERCRIPAPMRDWPATMGVESLARLADDRFLAIAEDEETEAGGKEALLFTGDPTDPATPPPAPFSYVAPEGYLPTDAIGLGAGRLLVLNRRVTMLDLFTARLSLVDIDGVGAGAVRRGRVVASFQRPLLHDNFEALALSWEGGQPVLWMASDDNHMVFQRTLLLKFALPPEWVSPGGR